MVNILIVNYTYAVNLFAYFFFYHLAISSFLMFIIIVFYVNIFEGWWLIWEVFHCIAFILSYIDPFLKGNTISLMAV